MPSTGCQILGICLAMIGFLGSIIICGLPNWKVSAFIGANIVTSQIIWEGLWMNCVVQSTGQMQCKVYDSLLALPQDLQGARALVIVAIIAGVFGIILSIVGGKCTNFVEDEASKAKVAIASGIIFIIAGILVLVPVCWTANTIIRDFYNPLLVEGQKREPFTMASLGMHMLASALALLGWVGALMSCIMPMWRVTAFVGTTIVTSEIMWEGIWMSCVIQSTGQMQCKPYESMLALGTDLQAARALTVMAILLGAVGLVLTFIGGKCTIFMDRSKRSKARIATAAGVTLIVAGVVCLIPVSWSAGIVVRAFYNPQMADSQRREIGGAIYIGWGASIVLILGGGMLCTTICKEKTEDDSGRSVKYLIVRSSQAGSSGAGSQRMRPISVRSLQSSAPSVRSQWSQKAPLNQGRPPSVGSHQSSPSTTKSQLARAEVMPESERDEGASAKSQLIDDGLDQTLAASEPSETEDAPKTYI
ncbi:uncharacterized protein cldn30 [Onychostoma macrolepis]|uniref:uncharacterized protein cldn30 n=1 Tax=Onychostoma macrolepis TaxID=369639 RepID=UPI00272BE43E|nr:uncharacterized protein cldn30 [Onychostoma macrolepis]